MSLYKRLVRTEEFAEVFNQGKSVVDRFLVLYYLPKRQEVTRFGFSVGKKVGHAVARNRIKRVLREITRINSQQIKSGYDCVIIARPRLVEENYRTIEKSFLYLARKAKIIGKERPNSETPGSISN